MSDQGMACEGNPGLHSGKRTVVLRNSPGLCWVAIVALLFASGVYTAARVGMARMVVEADRVGEGTGGSSGRTEGEGPKAATGAQYKLLFTLMITPVEAHPRLISS